MHKHIQARRQGGFLVARKPPFLCNLWVGLSIIIMHMPTIIAEPRDVCVYPVRRFVKISAVLLSLATGAGPLYVQMQGLGRYAISSTSIARKPAYIMT